MRTTNTAAGDVTELELLLPWYAAGTLGGREARLAELALVRYPALACRFELIWQERAETIRLNENLGIPSPGVLRRLLAAIEADDSES